MKPCLFHVTTEYCANFLPRLHMTEVLIKIFYLNVLHISEKSPLLPNHSFHVCPCDFSVFPCSVEALQMARPWLWFPMKCCKSENVITFTWIIYKHE
jgi:hypothetical protein